MNAANPIPAVMRILNQSRATVYKEIREGRLKTFTVGRRRYVSDQAINDYIAARERESEAVQTARQPEDGDKADSAVA